MLIPMTLAMAWGLTSGTILTLVWVPCAYAILEDFSKAIDKLFGKNKDNRMADKGHQEMDEIYGERSRS